MNYIDGYRTSELAVSCKSWLKAFFFQPMGNRTIHVNSYAILNSTYWVLRYYREYTMARCQLESTLDSSQIYCTLWVDLQIYLSRFTEVLLVARNTDLSQKGMISAPYRIINFTIGCGSNCLVFESLYIWSKFAKSRYVWISLFVSILVVNLHVIREMLPDDNHA